MEFDLHTLPPAARYKLLVSLVVPRPIAWVTTVNPDGTINAAPFSFFNVLGTDPPLLALGVGNRAPQTPKDTAVNIQRTGAFVVHLVNEALIEAMNLTAIDFPPGVSEAQAAHLDLTPSKRVPVPRIQAAPVAFECRHHTTLEIGHTRVILGEAVRVFVDDRYVLDPAGLHLNTPALRLIGRMHGPGWYTRTRDLFHVPRITYAEWRETNEDAL